MKKGRTRARRAFDLLRTGEVGPLTLRKSVYSDTSNIVLVRELDEPWANLTSLVDFKVRRLDGSEFESVLHLRHSRGPRIPAGADSRLGR